MPFSRDDTDRIITSLHAALASSSLSQWRRTFLSDMLARFETYGTRTRLSDKQYAKLKQTLAPFETVAPAPHSRRASPRVRSTRSAPRQKHRPPARPQSPMRMVRQARRSLRKAVWTVAVIFGLFAGLASIFDAPGPASMPSAPVSGTRDAGLYSSADFSITDGDTVQLRGARTGTRLVGFNTPETYEPRCTRERDLGQRATARLLELVHTADRVELRLVACACPPGTQGTRDCNFGRSCGVLRVDGRDVGDILINEGLAVRFRCGSTGCPPLPRPWCG